MTQTLANGTQVKIVADGHWADGKVGTIVDMWKGALNGKDGYKVEVGYKFAFVRTTEVEIIRGRS